MISKQCKKCLEVKDITNFYAHSAMKDGYLNSCKECVKTGVRANRERNIDYYRKFDRERYAADPEKHKEWAKAYIATPEGRAASNAACIRWMNRNPEAVAAHTAVNNAIKDGKLHKPNTCSACLRITPSRVLHGHHKDYSKQLDVTWLCAQCHSNEHKG